MATKYFRVFSFVITLFLIFSLTGCKNDVTAIFDGFYLGMSIEEAIEVCDNNLNCTLEKDTEDVPEGFEFYRVNQGLDSAGDIYNSFSCIFKDGKLIYAEFLGSVFSPKKLEKMSEKQISELDEKLMSVEEYMASFAKDNSLTMTGKINYPPEDYSDIGDRIINYATDGQTVAIWVIYDQSETDDVYSRRFVGSMFDESAVKEISTELKYNLMYVNEYLNR